ncbi:MAG: carboxypeptidase regulatory-like domain-containing protein [Anaerolineae bacterium]
MKRLSIVGVGLLVLVLLAAACGGGDDDKPPTATSPPKAQATTPPQPTEAPGVGGYQEVAVTNGGSIAGVVTFSGTPPKVELLTVDEDTDVCGTSQENPKLIVSAGGEIRNAVVSIKNITKGKAMAFPATVALDQHGCKYTPHVLIGPVGGTLQVVNSDPILHNVHSYTFDNPSVNRAQPKGSAAITSDLEFPEIIEIGCDIHGWMSAWLVVAEHPYYAITGDDGAFQLTDVPPGSYEVEVWHEELGTLSQAVTVEAGKTVEVVFELSQ